MQAGMDLAEEIRRELAGLADPERAVQEKRYLKSDLDHLGVPVPAIRKIVTRTLKSASLDRPNTLELVEELWSGVHEFRMAAIETLTHQLPLLESQDVTLAERLIADSATWAYVDHLAEKVVGGLLQRDPALGTLLDRYVRDPNFWIRRTALLALLPGIRHGAPDLDRLTRYGDLLITEREFFIRKALGWVLRELSKKDPAWVATWVHARLPAISGVTFREAIRHLPEPTQTRLTTIYRTRPTDR